MVNNMDWLIICLYIYVYANKVALRVQLFRLLFMSILDKLSVPLRCLNTYMVFCATISPCVLACQNHTVALHHPLVPALLLAILNILCVKFLFMR